MKSKRKYKLLKKLSVIIITSLILSYFLVNYYSIKITPSLIDYAEAKTKQITTTIINKAISEELENNYPSNLLNISRNSNNDIELINYNTQELAIILNKISKNIEKDIQLLETGNIETFEISPSILNNYYDEELIYNIPLGVASNNIFISNLGPKIPLKLKLNNEILTSVTTNIKEYGINNALLELNINIETNIQIILPFSHKITTIKLSSPLSIELINGKLPNYYYQSDLEYKNNNENN